jgi:hypothetical protein
MKQELCFKNVLTVFMIGTAKTMLHFAKMINVFKIVILGMLTIAMKELLSLGAVVKHRTGIKIAYLSVTVFLRKESAKENGKATVAATKLLIARGFMSLKIDDLSKIFD